MVDQLNALFALEGGASYADVAARLPPLLDMRPIPGGECWMGSGENASERPRHRVRVSPFHISSTPVTQAAYAAVMGHNPACFAGPYRPVEHVSWFDAIEFCNRLSVLGGRTLAYDVDGETVRWRPEADGYRLPTEAEWEYACRAGTETRWSTGDDDAGLGAAAWYAENGGGETHPVAQKAPNPWGLYDMHGNVWEWTANIYQSGGYSQLAIHRLDATDPAIGGNRMLRGGSFNLTAEALRSAVRRRRSPSSRRRDIGFRCVWGARQRPV